MPTRLLRDGILTSERVNALPVMVELHYRKLFSIVDDYGRYDAAPSILRAQIWGVREDPQVTRHQVEEWTKLLASGPRPLIKLYEVAGKSYLEISDFGQRIRAEKAKYPPPSDGTPLTNDGELSAPRGQMPADCKVVDSTGAADKCPQPADNCGQMSAQSESGSESYAETKTEDRNVKTKPKRFFHDAERFTREYPRAIDDEDMRHFVNYVENSVDEEIFFRCLPLNAATWKPGFIPKAENYLRKGTWKTAPKADAATGTSSKLWRQEDYL